MKRMGRCIPVAALLGCFAPAEPPLTIALNRDRSLSEVPDQWIVVLREGTDPQRLAIDAQRDLLATVLHVYDRAIIGFAFHGDSGAMLALRKDPRVQFVEPDQYLRPTSSGVQAPAHSGGLDRIDQRFLPLDNSYSWAYSGLGTHLYVLDGGIRSDHVDFAGRIGTGYDATPIGNYLTTCSRHGTQMSSVAAGTLYGVAKSATIHPVRITWCQDGVHDQGTVATALAGINWIAAHRTLPAVVNFSQSIEAVSLALAGAITNLVGGGTVFVAAAGNEPVNYCYITPQYLPNVIVVSGTNTAVDSTWQFAYGPCIDLYAPGRAIAAATTGGSTTNADSSGFGTSFSAPFVAGYALQYLELYPTATPQEVESAVKGNATSNIVLNVPGGTTRSLLYLGFGRGLTVTVGGPSTVTRGPWGLNQYTWTTTSTGGSGTPTTYQWYWGCGGSITPWAAIAGATGSSLTRDDLQLPITDLYVGVKVTKGDFVVDANSDAKFVDETNGQSPPGWLGCAHP